MADVFLKEAALSKNFFLQVGQSLVNSLFLNFSRSQDLAHSIYSILLFDE
jgi:hypothetical protein